MHNHPRCTGAVLCTLGFVLHSCPWCTGEFLRAPAFLLHQHMTVPLCTELCPSTSLHADPQAAPCTPHGTHPPPLHTCPHSKCCVGQRSWHLAARQRSRCTLVPARLGHRHPCTPAPIAQVSLHTVKLLCASPCTPAPCCTLPVCTSPVCCCTGALAHPCLLPGGPCTPTPIAGGGP